MTTRISLAFFLLLTAVVVNASPDRVYLSPMEDSRWTLTLDSPIRCEIEHVVPRFGKALFFQESARAMGMKFVSTHRFQKDMRVAFRSVTANWKSIQTQAVLGELMTTGGNDPLVNVEHSTARNAYFELQQGYQPSLFFIDEQDGFNSVAVILSTVRFRDVEAEFSRCIQQLHPYHFDDIRQTRVQFEFDDEFPHEGEEQAKLGKILNYLEVDPSVTKLVISGHTDFKGTECYNETLSARRAWYIYDYLIQSGIEPSMLEVEFFGETRPLATGKDDVARAVNRRVTVTMVR